MQVLSETSPNNGMQANWKYVVKKRKCYCLEIAFAKLIFMSVGFASSQMHVIIQKLQR